MVMALGGREAFLPYKVSPVLFATDGKVLDIDIKTSFCKPCSVCEKRKGTAEYEV